jgi:hypothetical protein
MARKTRPAQSPEWQALPAMNFLDKTSLCSDSVTTGKTFGGTGFQPVQTQVKPAATFQLILMNTFPLILLQ